MHQILRRTASNLLMTIDLNREQLIRKAAKGSAEAFEALILSCHSKAYAVAFRYMKNEADASDVLQEAYIKLYTKLKTFSFKSSFDTWFIRIVINCCYDALRQQKTDRSKRDQSEDGNDRSEMLPGSRSDESPEEAILKDERRAVLEQAMSLLSSEHRDVLILREYQQYSYEEIAGILELSEGTVKSRINRAKLRLREILKEQNPEFFV
ncbi:MAG: RNA polymerase sigma factor [Eubacteriales bacterium]|nr:RNA polymerase sigma factor [Eubacteriales bacterium]